jgi:hypothetical protein
MQTVQTHPVRGVEPTIPGVLVPVDLNMLIERVYTHPSSPEWLRDLVENLRFRYGLDKEAINATLTDQPVD